MLELADEADSKSVGSDTVRVRPPPPAPEKPTSFDLSVFQLNPPLRVGEIVFDDEIQLRWMKFAVSGEWVDLISSAAKPQYFTMTAGHYFTYTQKKRLLVVKARNFLNTLGRYKVVRKAFLKRHQCHKNLQYFLYFFRQKIWAQRHIN